MSTITSTKRMLPGGLDPDLFFYINNNYFVSRDKLEKDLVKSGLLLCRSAEGQLEMMSVMKTDTISPASIFGNRSIFVPGSKMIVTLNQTTSKLSAAEVAYTKDEKTGLVSSSVVQSGRSLRIDQWTEIAVSKSGVYLCIGSPSTYADKNYMNLVSADYPLLEIRLQEPLWLYPENIRQLRKRSKN